MENILLLCVLGVVFVNIYQIYKLRQLIMLSREKDEIIKDLVAKMLMGDLSGIEIEAITPEQLEEELKNKINGGKKHE